MLAKNPMAEAWTLMAAMTAAEDRVNERVERQGQTDAEVTEGEANWYLIRAYPGDDAKALRWLARRRFGAFRPMQQRHDKLTGKALQGWEPAFPGWIFVLCWDIGTMRTRITSCPGVMDLLCDPATNKPVPIEDGFVERVRALSWVYDENAPDVRHYSGMRADRNVKRIRPRVPKIDKRTRKTLQKLKNALRAQGRWDSSTWESANELAPHQRIALLQRTLNAPSLVA
jgi:transcription antitermination factor NusG